MAEPDYSVQRTFIHFDVSSRGTARTRSKTWDCSIFSGQHSDGEEAENVSTSSGSARGGLVSDEAWDISSVEADVDCSSSHLKEAHDISGSLPYNDAPVETSARPLNCMAVPWYPMGNGTPLPNVQDLEVLPPFTVRIVDMSGNPQGFAPCPFSLEGPALDSGLMRAHSMQPPEWFVQSPALSLPPTRNDDRNMQAATFPEFTKQYIRAVGNGGCCKNGTKDERTTIMFRGLPNDYTRDMLVELLDADGFYCRYDFVHVPVDLQRLDGFGKAFVNFVSREDAESARAHFRGFQIGARVCEISWAQPLQGFAEHCERYRNSPVMHGGVPDSIKPAVFQDGQRIEFPRPTRRIPSPRRKPNQVRGR